MERSKGWFYANARSTRLFKRWVRLVLSDVRARWSPLTCCCIVNKRAKWILTIRWRVTTQSVGARRRFGKSLSCTLLGWRSQMRKCTIAYTLHCMKHPNMFLRHRYGHKNSAWSSLCTCRQSSPPSRPLAMLQDSSKSLLHTSCCNVYTRKKSIGDNAPPAKRYYRRIKFVTLFFVNF